MDQLQDRWAGWVLGREGAGAEALRTEENLGWLAGIRDRVLDGADLRADDTLLDLGCGDGLIGFGALARLSDSGRVIFVDHSQQLLDECSRIASELGVHGRCWFMQVDAQDLASVGEESVDVVTTRSVLIYLAAKQRAFEAIYRVLRPGGRLSIFEPINSFTWPSPEGVWWGYDVSPVADLAKRIDAAQEPAEASTLTDFDEHDLVRFAEQAGFAEVRLTFEATIEPRPWFADTSWESFLSIAPNPLALTLGEAINEALTPDESERFAAHVRPLVEHNLGSKRQAHAFLVANKAATPPDSA